MIGTKLDKLAPNKRKPALRKLSKGLGQRVLGFSAHDGEGREAALASVLELAGLAPNATAPSQAG